jgi:hypothetical protein
MKIILEETKSSESQDGMQRTRGVGERGGNQARGHDGALGNVQTLDTAYDYTSALGAVPISLMEMIEDKRQAPRTAIELRWPRNQGDQAQQAAAMSDIRVIIQRVLEELDEL